jgi:hypothetical protein
LGINRGNLRSGRAEQNGVGREAQRPSTARYFEMDLGVYAGEDLVLRIIKFQFDLQGAQCGIQGVCERLTSESLTVLGRAHAHYPAKVLAH